MTTRQIAAMSLLREEIVPALPTVELKLKALHLLGVIIDGQVDESKSMEVKE